MGLGFFSLQMENGKAIVEMYDRRNKLSSCCQLEVQKSVPVYLERNRFDHICL